MKILITETSSALLKNQGSDVEKALPSLNSAKLKADNIPDSSQQSGDHVPDLVRSTDSTSSAIENRIQKSASSSNLKNSVPDDIQAKDKTLKVATTTADNSASTATVSQSEKQPSVSAVRSDIPSNGIEGKAGVMEFMDFVQPEPAIKVSSRKYILLLFILLKIIGWRLYFARLKKGGWQVYDSEYNECTHFIGSDQA